MPVFIKSKAAQNTSGSPAASAFQFTNGNAERLQTLESPTTFAPPQGGRSSVDGWGGAVTHDSLTEDLRTQVSLQNKP